MKFFYDTHIHTCLSPCGHEDSTPCNVVNMAVLNGLHIIAVTDHNTVKHCRPAQDAGAELGVTVIAGMELTTSEDIHVLCLFEHIEGAEDFERHIDRDRLKIANKPDIFGHQKLYGGKDVYMGEEQILLTPATAVSVYAVARLTAAFGGVALPAHIDREANGILSALGSLDEDMHFTAVEFSGRSTPEFRQKPEFSRYLPLVNSDAHTLWDIHEKNHHCTLEESTAQCFLHMVKTRGRTLY